MPFSSLGIPGKAIKFCLLFSTIKEGAVPKLLVIIFAVLGNVACLLLDSG